MGADPAAKVEYLVTERRLLAWVMGPGGEVHGSAVEIVRDRLREMVLWAAFVLVGEPD